MSPYSDVVRGNLSNNAGQAGDGPPPARTCILRVAPGPRDISRRDARGQRRTRHLSYLALTPAVCYPSQRRSRRCSTRARRTPDASLSTSTQSARARVVHSSCLVILCCFSWCGPCKTLSPVIERVAEDPALNIDLVTIDIDQHIQLAQQFQARAVAMLLPFLLSKRALRASGLQHPHRRRLPRG